MERCSVADPDRLTGSVALQMLQLNFWDIGLSSDGEHDRKWPFLFFCCSDALEDEACVSFGFKLETHPEEYVYSER